MSTIKLYDADAYRTTCTAKVLACTKEKKGYAIVLDQTVFFPEEGGQTPDTGVFYDVDSDEAEASEKDTAANHFASSANRTPLARILDVQISADEVITHFCDASVPVGTTVVGKIDWAHRYSNMQQHTGEHIFSGVVHTALGYENVGFHLSDHIVTMDYDGPLSPSQIKDFERQANAWIHKNVPVRAYYPDADALSSLSYRSKEGIIGDIRIVEIDGCDVCACCAPHVAHTGEVGILKVVDFQKWKGGTRLSILCGMRALDDYDRKQEILMSLSRTLSKPLGELMSRVSDLLAERDDLKQALYAAKEEQLSYMMQALPADSENVCLFILSCDKNLARKTVNTLTSLHSGYCMICIGDDAAGYSFILGSAKNDAQSAAKLLRDRLDAKCGGSPQMIQGSLPATQEAIRDLLL